MAVRAHAVFDPKDGVLEAERRADRLMQQLSVERWRSLHARLALCRERESFRTKVYALRQHSEMITAMYHSIRQKLEEAAVRPAPREPFKAGARQGPRWEGRPWQRSPAEGGRINDVGARPPT